MPGPRSKRRPDSKQPSFGNTVENMFHVSFLVKQRVVQLSIDDSIGVPVLEPVSSRVRDAAEAEEGGGNHQPQLR